jgi:hypothetical protein
MPSNPGDNKPSTGVRATDVARAGYEGYGDWTGWRTYDDRDMPRWDDLPDNTRLAWVAAAAAITRKVLRPTPHEEVEERG